MLGGVPEGLRREWRRRRGEDGRGGGLRYSRVGGNTDAAPFTTAEVLQVAGHRTVDCVVTIAQYHVAWVYCNIKLYSWQGKRLDTEYDGSQPWFVYSEYTPSITRGLSARYE